MQSTLLVAFIVLTVLVMTLSYLQYTAVITGVLPAPLILHWCVFRNIVALWSCCHPHQAEYLSTLDSQVFLTTSRIMAETDPLVCLGVV